MGKALKQCSYDQNSQLGTLVPYVALEASALPDNYGQVHESSYQAMIEPFVGISQDLTDAASQVLVKLNQAGLTMSTAESCTGGMISTVLTAVPGSSSCFLGSCVSYAIPIKKRILRVSSTLLDTQSLGAVSSFCALQMALGVRKKYLSDVSVSVTGIAGPGGEEPHKPVGTVWICASSAWHTTLRCIHAKGTRFAVRAYTTKVALSMMSDVLDEYLGAQDAHTCSKLQ